MERVFTIRRAVSIKEDGSLKIDGGYQFLEERWSVRKVDGKYQRFDVAKKVIGTHDTFGEAQKQATTLQAQDDD